MIVEFDPAGAGATKSFEIENDSSDRAPIQISMFRRDADVDGRESLAEADADWVVYPPQFILGPKERRTVRVTWVGNAAPTTELSFRIVAEQLPVELQASKKKTAGVVNVLLRYVGSVYVTPSGAQSKLAVSQSALNADATKLDLTIANEGNAHELVQNVRLVAKVTGAPDVTLEGEALKGFAGENILAGKARRFSIAWPATAPKKGLQSVVLKK